LQNDGSQLAHERCGSGENSEKKAKTLSQEIVQLGKRLPEFVVLNDILGQLDLNSPDGREIALIIQSLNQSCPE
jgi:hypothetical protein